MPRTRFIDAIRQPGISRKLTLAFGAVILVVALTIPVTFYAFHQIDAASDQAKQSSATLQNVATFQRALGDVRSAARDFADEQDRASRTAMTTTLQTALDAARCIADPTRCTGDMQPGEQLPPSEAAQWNSLLQAASDAKVQFESGVDFNPAVSVVRFDRALAADVDEPAQALAQSTASRGLAAQSKIKQAISSSMALIAVVLGAAILLAAALATIIPRRLMGRLGHLRLVAHRLSHGDLDARADEALATRNDEIGDLIADFNLMAGALQRQNGELTTVQEQLRISLQQEQERATRDPLTGLRNHRYFQDCLRAEIERCRRTGGQVSVAVLDLDDFKQVNDRFGHSEGDAVLLRATKGIADNLRPYDLACRLGGEEFGIIFPEASAEDALHVMERVAQHVLPFGPNGERLTFSGGITTWPVHATSQSDLYQRADEAAYTAKMNGKAATVIYDPLKVTSMNSEERTKQRSRDAMLTTATTLVSAVDQKDPYTRNHSELVAIYAATVARAMRLDEQTVKLVYRAGLLHDVGKIGIADDILVKGEQLTHDEWVQLQMHPEFSYRILEAAEMEPVATWTRHHHEHFDGSGYPTGIAGDAIPIGSRIILVADAFEAMTSDRVYRRALGVAQALHELRTGSGRQFDPVVAETMVSLVEQGVFEQVMRQYGRVIDPPVVDAQGAWLAQPDATTSSAVASAAALDGVPPPPQLTAPHDAPPAHHLSAQPAEQEVPDGWTLEQLQAWQLEQAAAARSWAQAQLAGDAHAPAPPPHPSPPAADERAA